MVFIFPDQDSRIYSCGKLKNKNNTEYQWGKITSPKASSLYDAAYWISHYCWGLGLAALPTERQPAEMIDAHNVCQPTWVCMYYHFNLVMEGLILLQLNYPKYAVCFTLKGILRISMCRFLEQVPSGYGHQSDQSTPFSRCVLFKEQYNKIQISKYN